MKSMLLSAAALISLVGLAEAQTPKLLKDINATLELTSSYPGPMASRTWTGAQTFSRLGKAILVSATTEATGYELWITDGTATGTKITLLKDINPGVYSSLPRAVAVTNDGKRAFFAADDGKTGFELWVTDGTAAGTRLVRDIQRGQGSSYPSELVAMGPSSVVFRANTTFTGTELFISNGTTAGTVLLKDIQMGPYSSSPIHLRATRDGKKVFFAASNLARGKYLWVTDGTSKGTKPVPGSQAAFPYYPTPFGTSQIVFQGYSANSGTELWISDGTSQGTKMVVDLNSGRGSGASTQHAIALGNRVLFRGFTSGKGMEAYVTDGTAKGTVLLIDANPGLGSGSLHFPHLDSTGKKIYWTSNTGPQAYRIFVTDGTPAGSKMFSPKDIGDSATSLVESLGKVYFQANNLTPGTGKELCVTDGTLAGTKTIRDTIPGKSSGFARYLTRMDPSRVFYTAEDLVAGHELRRMSSGSLFQLIDIHNPKVKPTCSSHATAVVRFGKFVLFSADDGIAGHEPWISDGTAAGTRMIKDLGPGIELFRTRNYAAAGDKLIFDAYSTATGIELFVTDGTRKGTRLLKDVRKGQLSSFPDALTSIGGKVYFYANDGIKGNEPWVSDGTSAGTRMIKDLFPGVFSSSPGYFAGHGNQVVFRAISQIKVGYELHITDGTEAGTKLLKDIRPSGSSYPAFMAYSAGKVYFGADDGKSGFELWTTDFTSAGTRMVTDLVAGGGSSSPSWLSARDGKVYFSAYSHTTGTELFVSDGTPAGTKLFWDQLPGRSSSFPRNISAVGSRKVYFANKTRASGIETIVTDGTIAGTRLLDIYPGTGSGLGYFGDYHNPRATLGSQVFLRSRHPLYDLEIFTVDNGATAEPLGTPYGSTWIHGSDPVLGKTATITGGTSLANAVHITLFGSVAARPSRLGSAGFAHFDLTRYFDITGVTQGASFQYKLAVPNNPALKGVQLVFQTLSLDPQNLAGTLELSNGLHWAVGN